MNRRAFTTRAALSVMAIPAITNVRAKNILFNTATKVPIGLDAHAIRSTGWKAPALIDYTAELGLNHLLMNHLGYYESLDEKYLKKLAKQAEKKGVSIDIGIGSLSKNSTSYNETNGNAKQRIELGIKMAGIFGAKSVNCMIGNFRDRHTEGGIEARMEEIIGELKAMRTQISDAGLKFGIENHAGDTRAEEVLTIIEEVGSDVCGAMVDPGNSVWTMENPMEHIQKLGKYAVCSSIRDYRIWESDKGATFQWTAIGDGIMDFPEYTRLMSELCPGVPLYIETINDLQLDIAFLTDDFWKGYPNIKGSDMKEFLSRIRQGEAIPLPEGGDKAEHQKQVLTKSIDYLKAKCPAVEG